MTHRLLNIFHCTADNIGDRMCGPSQYLWPHLANVTPISRSLPEGTETAIIGGGQIFAQLDKLSKKNSEGPNSARLIAWGVGIPPRGEKNRLVRRVAKRFQAFSTRNYDWKDELPFVPCPSCLSPHFDNPPPPVHDIVIFNHRRKPGAIEGPAGVPILLNSVRDAKLAIDFIASGETVVTSSYHGVYWAQLLGRRVVCIPYNSKFLTFQYSPSLASTENWIQYVRTAKSSPPLLEEYRSINQSFARRVEQMWND